MTDLPANRARLFLEELKANWRSSPAGKYWSDFYETLCRMSSDSKPPAPLILAASGASDRAKHSRLAAQLEWAINHACLDPALEYLSGVPAEGWNVATEEGWDREYWT